MSEKHESENVLKLHYEQYDFYEAVLPEYRRKGTRISRYHELVKKFLESDMKTARIELKDIDKRRIYQGLRTAIIDHHIYNVTTHFRENQVYLTRNDEVTNNE